MASENSDYSPDKAFRPRRAPGRECFDRATVHAILDDGYVAHAGFQGAQGPEIIPVFYVRAGERVLIHLSAKAGLSMALKRGEAVTLAVTHLDGLILARSAFHHSMNYRSVIIHGAAVELAGEEKADALDLMVERVEEGRSAKARRANAQEMKATAVFAVPLEQVAAKLRTGGPKDDPEDMALPVWAGTIPLELIRGKPLRDISVDAEGVLSD
ncbi:pyridoxamine 5'-phosphate oxidase family protein [Parvibaculum sp. MBR-TMA-1.3b-4.2]|jgi:nitroimidazol reductase NimA-like FMN-containing flavoprotein (pyridoxamine 5'-phosphate oxidase superfamily)